MHIYNKIILKAQFHFLLREKKKLFPPCHRCGEKRGEN